VDTAGLIYLVQDSLRKHNFDIRTNKLQEALIQRDAQKSEIPVPRDMLATLVSRYT